MGPKQVKHALLQGASRGVVGDAGEDSPNLLLYVPPPPCLYVPHENTSVFLHSLGLGKELQRKDFASDTEYLEACEAECNADAKCKGFVDDRCDDTNGCADMSKLRECRKKSGFIPKTPFVEDSKTFWEKGVDCFAPNSRRLSHFLV